jgi:hypothetical protein
MSANYYSPQFGQPQYAVPPQYVAPPLYDVRPKESSSNPLLILLIIAALFYIASIIYNYYIKKNDESNKNEENKPKFKLNDSKSTAFNALGDSENYYLDRHNLTCETKSGINKFQYILGDQTKDDTKNTFQYKYTCTNGGELEDTLITKTTTANDDGGGNYYHLDRHDVACGSDEILNQFVLKRPETGKINYSYNCIKSKKPLTCRKVETTKVNNVDGDNTKNLKNHNISCADDEVLQSFLLTRGTPNTLVGYDYTCCKY